MKTQAERHEISEISEVAVAYFFRYPVGDGHCRHSSRLSNPNHLPVVPPLLKDILRDLGRFPAACVSRDNQNLVLAQL